MEGLVSLAALLDWGCRGRAIPRGEGRKGEEREAWSRCWEEEASGMPCHEHLFFLFSLYTHSIISPSLFIFSLVYSAATACMHGHRSFLVKHGQWGFLPLGISGRRDTTRGSSSHIFGDVCVYKWRRKRLLEENRGFVPLCLSLLKEQQQKKKSKCLQSHTHFMLACDSRSLTECDVTGRGPGTWRRCSGGQGGQGAWAAKKDGTGRWLRTGGSRQFVTAAGGRRHLVRIPCRTAVPWELSMVEYTAYIAGGPVIDRPLKGLPLQGREGP